MFTANVFSHSEKSEKGQWIGPDAWKIIFFLAIALFFVLLFCAGIQALGLGKKLEKSLIAFIIIACIVVVCWYGYHYLIH